MIEEWLRTLGINTTSQWDVVVFLHRHRTALLNADNIARLMRYKTAPIIAALDSLETLGLVDRSRLSQGARLYQLSLLDGPRGHAFEQLLALSESRTGRLAISEKLNNIRSRKTIFIKALAPSKSSGKVDRRREQGLKISRREAKHG